MKRQIAQSWTGLAQYPVTTTEHLESGTYLLGSDIYSSGFKKEHTQCVLLEIISGLEVILFYEQSNKSIQKGWNVSQSRWVKRFNIFIFLAGRDAVP